MRDEWDWRRFGVRVGVAEREEPRMKPRTLAWPLAWLVVSFTKMRNSKDEQGWGGCGERAEFRSGYVEC